jgi:hypothetical protein
LLLGPEFEHFGRRHVGQLVVIVLELDQLIVGGDPAEHVALQQRAQRRPGYSCSLARDQQRFIAAEELKDLPPAASMQLRCDICKERHVFVLAECAVDDEKN